MSDGDDAADSLPISLGETDSLDGGTVVSGFSYPVARLFA
jgi:hypothetical protein